MRIARIQVGAFLGLRDRDYAIDSPPTGGLVLIEGPNEAGKTSLLRFVRQMLFGGAEEIRGALVVEHDGRRYRLERHGKGKRFDLIDLTTGGRAEARLDDVLGHLDAKVYQSVFAFGLDELQALETLTGDDVQERIYSASVAGAGRNARAVLRALQAEADELLLPRAGSTLVARLAGDLKEARRAVEAARAQAAAYDQLRAEEAALDRRVQAAQERLAELRAERARMERLVALWPAWSERLGLRERLAAAGDAASRDGAWLAAGDTVSGLATELAVQQQRASDAQDLLAAIQHAAADADAARARLGEGWDEARVVAYESASAWRAAAATARQQAADTDRALRDADVRLAAAERLVANARDRLAEAPAPDADPRELAVLAEAARQGVERVAACEGAWDERDSVERSIHTLVAAIADADTLARRGAARRWVGWGLAVAAALAGAVWLRDAPRAWPAGLAGLALTLAWLLWPGLSRVVRVDHGAAHRAAAQQAVARQAVAQQAVAHQAASPAAEALPARLQLERDLGGARQRRAELDEQIAALVDDATGGRAALRAASARAHAELERVERELGAAHARAAAHERARAALERAREELEAASGARAAADERRAATAAAWRSWCGRHDVPAWVGPNDVGTFVDAVTTLRGQVLRLHADRQRLAELRRAVAAFEATVRSVAERLPVDAPERRGAGGSADPSAAGRADRGATDVAAIGGTVAAWEQRLEEARERQRWRARVAAIEGQVEAAFGVGAAAARAQLEERSPLAWGAQADRLAADIEALQHELVGEDGLVARRRDAQRARQALEAAADLANHAAEAAVGQAALEAALRRWLVVRLAADLIQETLAEYQRTRVPAVLRHAGETLAHVTRGRYVGVRQGDGTLRLVTADDDALDASVVSRGTREQLYLALRLGLVDAFAEQRGSLPLVMDDVMVNADPERAEAMAAVLAHAAERHQMLYLTCHPHTVARLREAAPGAVHLRLERLSAG